MLGVPLRVGLYASTPRYAFGVSATIPNATPLVSLSLSRILSPLTF